LTPIGGRIPKNLLGLVINSDFVTSNVMDDGITYLMFAVLVSIWNRNGLGWFLISLMITPIFAAAVILSIIGEHPDYEALS